MLVGVVARLRRLAARVPRLKLIAVVTCFFIACLDRFYVSTKRCRAHRLALGIAFFIWVGCFNVMMVAQFWAFANDLYTRGRGRAAVPHRRQRQRARRGSGRQLAKPLFLALWPLHADPAGGRLAVVCSLLTWLVHTTGKPAAAGAPRALRSAARRFPAAARDRYLQLVGALIVVKNRVNTTGEYILDRRLIEAAHQKVGTSTVAVEKFIGAFKSDYFTYVNAIVLGLQLAAVSRIIRYLGVRRALYVLPLVALSSYGTMAMVPLLSVIFVGKIAENSLDYSLQKTVEQTLFLRPRARRSTRSRRSSTPCSCGSATCSRRVWCGWARRSRSRRSVSSSSMSCS